MRFIPALPFLLIVLTVSASVNATTWDEIARLEAHKQAQLHSGTPVMTPPGPALRRLSDGRQVNLRDWKIVLFMSSSCPHCHAFDPVLKAIARDTGFSVFPYTLDGRGDASWPQAIPAPPMVITEFFAQGLPIATPTLFLVNVNNMKTYPLQQGESEREAFMVRLDDVLRFAMDNGENR
jgi:type-F conjugative transfer system pilin assembly thiol-disulfide isomerase TrbB